MSATAVVPAVDSRISAVLPPPDLPRRVRLGMPQLDAAGLSEGWWWRHAGELHWQQIVRQLAARSDEISDDAGERLYPTFVAVRARYSVPLAAAGENDVLDAAAELLPCGGGCALGRIAAAVQGPPGGLRLQMQMLSSFARREAPGRLRLALPAARLARRWVPRVATPALSHLARAGRRQEAHEDSFSGVCLGRGGPELGAQHLLPSPYADYNGAGLLYFASYLTLADTVERLLVHRLGLGSRLAATPTTDWALAASPVRRDIFYYRNLPLGQAVEVALAAFEPLGDGVKTHLRLRRASDGVLMADVVTHKLLVPRPR